MRGLERFKASSDSQALMYMNSDTTHGKILKFADQMLKFPKKERFNQDLDASVKEMKQRPQKSVIKMSGEQLASFDIRSHRSSLGGSVNGGMSTKSKMSTLTKEEL